MCLRCCCHCAVYCCLISPGRQMVNSRRSARRAILRLLRIADRGKRGYREYRGHGKEVVVVIVGRRKFSSTVS
ncbi:hypothetical protein DL95DRAFT_391370 [Leptodontidium sp. 2 PMI_412]|nr:hypothetical protein DL95DRAFT_391370 [Leptodontidium sp. 2 PMI_412]